jgi:hypothetical protein
VSLELIDRLEPSQGFAPVLATFAGRVSRGRRLYFASTSGVRVPPPGRGRRYWVVSRALCRFFHVPLPADTDRAHYADAVALEIKRLSPFERTGSHLHVGAGFAAVWLWDQQEMQAAATAVGVDIDRARVLPEPALRPALAEGARLIEGLDGVEAQYWTDGALSASRWWPHLPDERAWVAFQRGASIPPDRLDAAVPEPLHLPWLDRPWTRSWGAGALSLSRLDLRLIAAGVAVAMLAAYGYEGARYLHAEHQAAALAREVAEQSAAMEPILASRTAALANLDAIQTLHRLDRFPGQLTLIARIAENLPPGRSRIEDWLYDRGQVELSIADDQPVDVVKLVRALEDSALFSGVVAERTGNNNTVRLHASVVPR